MQCGQVSLSRADIDATLQNLSSQPTMGLSDAGLGRETWSRYLVENYFQHWKWYNPNVGNSQGTRDKNEEVTLSKGWAFFEHFTLPRHYVGDSSASSSKQSRYIRARAGETSDTELYSVFFTPRSAFSDWGIGVSMYFSTLLTMCCIFILVGMLNVVNIMFYSSTEYDPKKSSTSTWELLDMLRFSAVCMDREWVVCNGCSEQRSYWSNIFAHAYYGTTTDAQGEEVTLINRTICDPAQFDQGMWNLGALLLLVVAVSAFLWRQKNTETKFYQNNKSAPDYTVIVKNPPGDAHDAEEWRDFFEEITGHKGKFICLYHYIYTISQLLTLNLFIVVTLCTIALDNERLINKLVLRRKDMKSLRSRLGVANIDLDDKAKVEKLVDEITTRQEKSQSSFEKLVHPILRRFGFSTTDRELWERYQSTTEAIKSLQKEEYKVSAVYITFETEQGQRNTLEALNASRTELLANTAIGLDPSALFRDTVLHVTKASEPTAVRWLDLNYTPIYMNIRTFFTLCITLGLVAASAFILHFCRTRVGTTLYAIILSTLNCIIPMVGTKEITEVNV